MHQLELYHNIPQQIQRPCKDKYTREETIVYSIQVVAWNPNSLHFHN